MCSSLPSLRRTLASLLFVLLPVVCPRAQASPAAGKPTTAVTAVASPDGTCIACERSGAGPAVILVACALADRSGASGLARLLAPHATVCNYDRRGRGGSGDAAAGKPPAISREVEDLAAVIAAAGGSAVLFGSSSGAALALEAAEALPDKVTGIVLHEPPYVVDDSRLPIPDSLFPEIDALVNGGKRGEAVALFMRRAIGVPDEMLADMKQAPMWRGLERLAHSLRYDGALVAGLTSGKPLPADRWRHVTARVLVLDGENSPPSLRHTAKAVAALVRGGTHRTLPGQDHSVVFTAPAALVSPIVEFLAGPARRSDKK